MAFELHLDTETVEHVRPAPALIVSPDAELLEVMSLMRRERMGCVLVCRDGVLEGLFTERDALGLMAVTADWEVSISRVMTRNPVTVLVSDTVGAAIQKMSQGGYRRLPVVDNHRRAVGLLKVSTILDYLVQHFPAFVYNLPPNPHHAMQSREGA